MAKTLTAIAVKNLRPRATRYEVPDGGCRGLWLIVQPTGVKSWAARYRFRGVPRKHTLGSVLIEDGRREPPGDKPFANANSCSHLPVLDTPLTLADARWLATEALRQVKSGIDPSRLKRGRPADTTVRVVADDYLRRHTHLRSLNRVRYDASLVCQSLGSHLIGDVTRLDIVRLLDRIQDENGAATADRVRAIWSAIANWHASRTEDYRPPVVRGKRSKNGARMRVLADDELARIWRATEAMQPFGDLVRFLLLTAARRDEARCMRRSELVDSTTWVLPAERCKIKRAVLIPLSAPAQGLIAGMPHIGDGDFLFTIDGRCPVGNVSAHKQALDRASGVTGWRLHDLRRTARTLLSRAGVAPDVGEQCLGHAVGGVRAVYDRHEFEQEKRAAFQALASLVGEIVDRTEGH